MDRFARYMSSVDGTRGWSELGPMFDEAFDPSATLVTADGEVDRAQWRRVAQGLVERGAVVTDFELKTPNGVDAVYKLTLTVGSDAPMDLVARARFRDGRLVRVEPADPADYAELVIRGS